MSLDDDCLRQGITDLRWRLGRLLAGGQSTLVVDVSGLDRMSSTTLAALLWVKRRCRARRVGVVVREPSRHSLEQLRRTGLMDAFDIESRQLQTRSEQDEARGDLNGLRSTKRFGRAHREPLGKMR